MSQPHPVLIAGGGPVGLVVALCLRQNGVPVRVIDKVLTYHIGARASGVMPRTLEIYQFLGVLSDVMKASRPCPTICDYELPGGTNVVSKFLMFAYTPPRPDRPYLNVRSLAQNLVQGILRSHLAKYDCQVELGTELRDFEDHGDHVVATLIRKNQDGTESTKSCKASYLVGSDGSRSTVRKLLRVNFDGETYEGLNMVFADVRVRGIEDIYWNKWGEMKNRMFTIRQMENDDHHWVLAGGRNLDTTNLRGEPESMTQWIAELTGRSDIKVDEVLSFTKYKPQMRMVREFSKGRVYLAGDSAHVHSPTGGQGLNNGVADAFALAWRLSLAYRSLASPELMSSYTEERGPIIKAMLEQTTALLEAASVSWGNFAQMGMGRNDRLPLYQLDINYRWSPVVLADKSCDRSSNGFPNRVSDQMDPIHAGDRAPDAPGLVDLSATSDNLMKTLFQYFKPTHHTALIFTSAVTTIDSLLSALDEVPKNVVRSAVVLPGITVVRTDNIDKFVRRSSVDFALKDCENHAYSTYSVDPSKSVVVIVRPDGMVGAIVGDGDGVRKYFRKILVV
ncbi:hypothetical protein NEOLEDRAFT_1143696 [Neolentinus lepideus HHB14362 ss-1]|uniref:Uncharacterized protein n=1 Tax=Neolentinus lepideus HHB14362 ss-1 TaxID=1314782 RepID=A0A165ME32_9AGAM|nr:hypothetical protein NEOLEDRAFT_1143696 [Neolentinus lepideus HHB14362 ss-1]